MAAGEGGGSGGGGGVGGSGGVGGGGGVGRREEQSRMRWIQTRRLQSNQERKGKTF